MYLTYSLSLSLNVFVIYVYIDKSIKRIENIINKNLIFNNGISMLIMPGKSNIFVIEKEAKKYKKGCVSMIKI